MKVVARLLVEFAVAAVSQNTNSFGLRQHVLVARDGETWTLCLNYLACQPVGGRITATAVEFENGAVQLSFPQGELPEKRPGKCPAELVEQAWAVVPDAAPAGR